MSGVGKGVASASIGKILQSHGFAVNPIKIDPYLNVDAGTMNPIEHGEVFVLSSGLETDQDMGSYERFLDLELKPENYMTNGMVFKTVIDRERALGYGGKCVEPAYHITEEVLLRIKTSVATSKADVTIIEIGGTVGEYQNAIFIEAARVLKLKHREDVIFVMVSYLPIPGSLGEMKTKPTQSAVRTLNSYGVHPDIIIARSTHPLDQKRKQKIADFMSVPEENIISAPDVSSIYDVPINFEKDGLSKIIIRELGLRSRQNSNLRQWQRFVTTSKQVEEELSIGIVGKYFKTGDFVLSDVYLSVIESLKHAAIAVDHKVAIDWIDASDYEADPSKLEELSRYDGLLVPGGFGSRGVEGKILAIQYAREHHIPYFGLCYGMQLALIEYARHVLGLTDAHTTEVNKKTNYPVIDVMPEQVKHLKQHTLGGTMRLGEYVARLTPGTIAHEAYTRNPEGRWKLRKGKSKTVIYERHRHRYEVSPEYVEHFTNAGVVFSGVSDDKILMEIMELPRDKHPFFLATQFHPEFTGSPMHPHPLFQAFLASAIKLKELPLA